MLQKKYTATVHNRGILRRKWYQNSRTGANLVILLVIKIGTCTKSKEEEDIDKKKFLDFPFDSDKYHAENPSSLLL